MITVKSLIKRNTVLFFKDKGMFFTSLITPLILLVLYTTFLGNVYEDSFKSVIEAAGLTIDEKLLAGCVGGQLFALKGGYIAVGEQNYSVAIGGNIVFDQ